MTREEIADFLAPARNAVLATLGPRGYPHQMAMWYLPEPDRILMWTYRKSQKALNLRRDPRASVLLEEGTAYLELRGVMIEGDVELIDDVGRVAEIGTRLFERYGAPGGEDRIGDLVAAQAPKRVGLALPLARVASWDHRKLAALRQ
jgi:PPOX class probable F420-dependent enzyme